MKVSYSCLQNILKIYKGHNSKVTSTPCNQLTFCNCIIKEEFPMDGKCQTMNAIFDRRVTSPELRKIYFGLTEGKWKKRYYNHKLIQYHKWHSYKTTFLSYVWHLKKILDEAPDLKWSVVRCVTPYSNISKKYLLCLHEKLVIINYPKENELLNKRSKLFCKYRLDNKYLLKNVGVNDKE